MSEAHNIDEDPFAKFSDGEGEDDTHTGTFVSMEEFNTSRNSLRTSLNNNFTTQSQQSTMAGIEVDEIGDNELLRAVAEATAPDDTPQFASFAYDFGSSPAPTGDVFSPEDATSTNEMETPLSSVRFAEESHIEETNNPILDAMMGGIDDDGDDEINLSGLNTTPYVIRNQFDAIQTVRIGGSDATDADVPPSLSDAVTSTTVPNFFKRARPYNAIADPSGNDTTLVLFSRIGPAGAQEIEALKGIAGSDEKSPLTRIVEMMAYTVEFQTHELYKLKSADLDIFDKYVGESQARWTEADRRRSLTIQGLLDELDKKGAHIKNLEKQLEESARTVKREKQLNEEFRTQCERLDPSIRFKDGSKKAFAALHNVLHSHRRKSEATVQKQKMEIEEYAEKLLKLERQLNESQQRQNTLLKENTSLRVELASHANSKDCNHRGLETPAVHCFESHQHADFTLLEEEKKILSKESEELRRELRAAQVEKVAMEDKLFSSNIESEELHRKLKSMKSLLNESEASIRSLKDAQRNLEEHSTKVAKELSQNTFEAAMELDKKDMEISQLRYELDDREAAINTYRSQIRELEKQISLSTEEAIYRGKSMASRPNSMAYGGSNMDSAVETLQREIHEARELLNEKHEEVDILKVSLAEMERNVRLAEEECELWKTSAQSNTFEHHLEDEETLRINQNDDFLRRLSVQLNCRAENKRDLIQKLVERIEALISERVALEEAREKLNGRIVEREKMIHAIRSEYDTEISALKIQLQQLEHSRDRAIADRTAAEAKLDDIAKGVDDSEFDFTLDMTNDFSIFDENRDGDEVDWKDPTINAAVKSVRHLVGSKMDLASRNEMLNAKLKKLLNSDGSISGEALSRDYLMETRDFNEELVSIIGQQQNTIKKLRSYSTRRFSLADGRSEANDDEPTMTFSINEDDTSVTYTQEFTQDDGTRQTKASAFLRSQLEEVRAQYTEKMNDNTKLSNVLKEMETRLDSLMVEKTSSEGKLSALEELHNKFVKSLSHLLKVRTTTVVVESAVRDLVNHSQVMETKNMELRTLTARQMVRVHKLGAQKRVFEHIMGLYIRNYNLNILALPSKRELPALFRFRAVVKALIAGKRMRQLASRQLPNQLPFEFVDVTKSFNLPVQFRIADARHGTLTLKSAVQAIQSSEKLQQAIADRERQIEELRHMLATLNTTVPSSETYDPAATSGFDYSQELVERKNEIAVRLKKVLQEKEELEVRLTHEKQHRASSEVRANKYLEKASKLHSKLQTLKLTAENRERTYKAAIRYLKQKADSAIDVDFENSSPNQVSEPASDASPSEKHSKHNHIQILSAQLEQAMEKMATLEKGTKEYKDCKHYVMGLRSAMKRFKRMNRVTTTSSRIVESTNATEEENQMVASSSVL